MHSSVCSSLLCIRETPPLSVLYDVLLLKTLRVHAPETPIAYSLHQRWLKPDLSREWKKRVRWICHLQKTLTNP